MANQWIEQLQLEPNIEGGYYRQTFETTQRVTVRSGASADEHHLLPAHSRLAYRLLSP